MHGAEGSDMAMYVSHPLPSAGMNFPTVIVAQEAFGVNSHIQKVCDQYAAAGYVAVAPALYHREHPNPMLGYGEDDVPARNRYMGALKDDELIEDINEIVRWTQGDQFRRTNGQKIGIVGYCVGGRIAYLAATGCPGISAASVYYGGRILVPFGDGASPIDLTSQIQIPVMGNFGGQDENPSPADVATIEAKLKECGVTYDFKSYPDCGHGFNCNDRSSYNEAAAGDAFTRTTGWFDKYLK
jgi:carboxymethylenebutenolidase